MRNAYDEVFFQTALCLQAAAESVYVTTIAIDIIKFSFLFVRGTRARVAAACACKGNANPSSSHVPIATLRCELLRDVPLLYHPKLVCRCPLAPYYPELIRNAPLLYHNPKSPCKQRVPACAVLLTRPRDRDCAAACVR